MIDEFKKSFDRYKQREKQTLKDVQQADIEVRQFHHQKQAALNQIEVIVPIKLSQIYAFEGSGVHTKPYDILASAEIAANPITNTNGRINHGINRRIGDVNIDIVISPEEMAERDMKEKLKDPLQRQLVGSVDTTHVLFNKL